jgi:hypothetical protein
MVTPRRRKDIERIIKQAGTKTAEADLEEYDRLLRGEIDRDPDRELSMVARAEQLSRDRRIRVLGRRLFKDSRKSK